MEYYLTSLLEDANLCPIHAKCITIMPKDSQLATVSVESTSSIKSDLVFVVGCVGNASMGKGGHFVLIRTLYFLNY